MSIALLLALLAVGTANPAVAEDHGPELTCRLCSVPKELSQADATFAVIVTAVASTDGTLKSVQVVKTALGLDSPVRDCISRWRLRGVQAGSPVNVVLDFKWGHWRRLRVSTDSVKFEVNLEPDEAR